MKTRNMEGNSLSSLITSEGGVRPLFSRKNVHHLNGSHWIIY